MKLGTWRIKRKHIFDLGTFGGSNHPPKVTLVVWLVCHSNSKLVFHFLVTIICLSSLTVLSPSKDTNIYPRHMIATKKWDNSWGLGGQSTPKVTLVVWRLCRSNSKLALHFLVTILSLSSLTVMSPSQATNIYPRHMIATKKWDNSWHTHGRFHFLLIIICLDYKRGLNYYQSYALTGTEYFSVPLQKKPILINIYA